jgi:hypothetical protein
MKKWHTTFRLGTLLEWTRLLEWTLPIVLVIVRNINETSRVRYRRPNRKSGWFWCYFCKFWIINKRLRQLSLSFKRNNSLDCDCLKGIPNRKYCKNFLLSNKCNWFFSFQGYIKDAVYVPPLATALPEFAWRTRDAVATVTLDLPNNVWIETEYRRATHCTLTEHL